MKNKRGRPPGATNETVEKVEQVYKLKAKGMSMVQIARKLGVTRSYVYHLYNTYEPA